MNQRPPVIRRPVPPRRPRPLTPSMRRALAALAHHPHHTCLDEAGVMPTTLRHLKHRGFLS